MTLGDVIDYLQPIADDDPDLPVPFGFSTPHSYRGYYEDLAFTWEAPTTVGRMLAAAQSAIGTTYHGWKGGDYRMHECSKCWLVRHIGETGETLGPVLLAYMTGNLHRLHTKP